MKEHRALRALIKIAEELLIQTLTVGDVAVHAADEFANFKKYGIRHLVSLFGPTHEHYRHFVAAVDTGNRKNVEIALDVLRQARKQIEEDDDWSHVAMLHTDVQARAGAHFMRGEYDAAIFVAFKEVEVAVRRAGRFGAEDLGKDLMAKAFNSKDGSLSDNSSVESEREALRLLFHGRYRRLQKSRKSSASESGRPSVRLRSTRMRKLVAANSCESRRSSIVGAISPKNSGAQASVSDRGLTSR